MGTFGIASLVVVSRWPGALILPRQVRMSKYHLSRMPAQPDLVVFLVPVDVLPTVNDGEDVNHQGQAEAFTQGERQAFDVERSRRRARHEHLIAQPQPQIFAPAQAPDSGPKHLEGGRDADDPQPRLP